MQPNIDPYNSKYKLINKDLLNQFFTQLKPHLKKSTDYVLAPETYFSEGYGEELISFKKSKIHNEIQKKLSEFQNKKIKTIFYHNLSQKCQFYDPRFQSTYKMSSRKCEEIYQYFKGNLCFCPKIKL